MTTNSFVREATMGAGTSFTENGALSYASIGTELLNQFAKAGTYRGRDLNDVFTQQSALWAENPEDALKFPFYLRMVTRKTKMFDAETETVQRGQGVRDEAFKRLLWFAKYHPEVFYKNLWVLPLVGSWKDLWVLLTMDDSLNKKEFFKVMAMGINNDYHRELVKKYMPRIRANKLCNTDWAKKTNRLAKEFCNFVGWTAKDYRIFKSTGKAHEFQRIICARLYDNLNFKAIPGKALLNLVSGNFLQKHGLEEKYLSWVKTQPVAKFNGYPYELAMKCLPYRNYYYGINRNIMPATLKFTLDKQFANLIETAKSDNGAIKGNVWCALDTSGSMTSPISRDSNVTSYDVAVGLGIYFSTLNEGEFHKNVIMFDNTSEVLHLKGDFTDMYNQIASRRDAMGGTNFQSVIDEIVRIRKRHPNIPLEDYPETLLVVSDMQFSISGGYWYQPEISEIEQMTNYETMKEKLLTVFPKDFVDKMKFVWWQVNGRTQDFPATMDHGGCYFFSGFDGSIISTLLGGSDNKELKMQPSMEEVIENVFSQEILGLLTL